MALVASADGTLSAAQVRQAGRPVVWWQGGIHAGEIDGKDAGFLVLRELLEGTVAPGVLGQVTLVFVPVFNVDGHERFGPHQRPNQVGPRETGWRVTSQNLNLNRDYLKAEAPEMVALLALQRAFDPVLLLDLHVTDGAQFQHDVSVTFEPRQQGPAGLRPLGRALQAALFAKLETQGHLPVDFYPQFVGDDDPASGFSTGWPPPRFAHSYQAARNRFGVLVETHSWKPVAHRVRTTADVCRDFMELAFDDAGRWQTAARQADLADEKATPQPVTLTWGHAPRLRPLDFQGYAYTRELSPVSGKPWVRYDESKPVTWRVPYYDELVPDVQVTPPAGGYLVPPQYAPLVRAKLVTHGLAFVEVKKPRTAMVEVYRVEHPVFRATPSEGRQVVTGPGAWSPQSRQVLAGSLFVPAAQAHRLLALHLFEPASPDSLFQWGFFNAHLEQKEYLEDYLAEDFARQQLADAGVRADFQAAFPDAGTGVDAAERLAFFARRHPSWDPELNVLPIWRTAQTAW